MELLKSIAVTNQTILITGRTGTGKTHLAEGIHRMSPRAAARFASVNLATLSENLIESELFGHEKGAFSGADQRRVGRLEHANGGTVFLDEIGELPLRLQVKLLDALNHRTITPVGSNREIKLNIRIIAATNRDLAKMVKECTFREDLFFRINAFQVHLKDLKDEAEKLVPLAKQFARAAAEEQGRSFIRFTLECEEALQRHTWPGNVRELKNAVEFAVAMSPDGVVLPQHLPPTLRLDDFLKPATSKASELPVEELFSNDWQESRRKFESLYIREMLKRNSGRINLTARTTGLSKVTLIGKIRRYRIDVNEIKFDLWRTQRASG